MHIGILISSGALVLELWRTVDFDQFRSFVAFAQISSGALLLLLRSVQEICCFCSDQFRRFVDYDQTSSGDLLILISSGALVLEL
jgi:hypothetical protein